MYSRETRMKAVQLFIDSNCNENHVLKTLGYPSPNALRNWYREYLSTGDLHSSGIHKACYSQQQTETAVQYYVERKTTLVQTCRALRKDTCKRSHCLVKYTDEEKRAAVEEFAVDRVSVYKVAIKYRVSKARTTKNSMRVIPSSRFKFLPNSSLSGKDSITASPCDRSTGSLPRMSFFLFPQCNISLTNPHVRKRLCAKKY